MRELTFKIEEKIGLLFQICACQNFQKVPHVMIPVEEKKRKIDKRRNFWQQKGTGVNTLLHPWHLTLALLHCSDACMNQAASQMCPPLTGTPLLPLDPPPPLCVSCTQPFTSQMSTQKVPKIKTFFPALLFAAFESYLRAAICKVAFLHRALSPICSHMNYSAVCSTISHPIKHSERKLCKKHFCL